MIIRDALAADAPLMADLLNEIIARGGTTARQHPMFEQDLREYFIDGPVVETSVLAQVGEAVIGWQSLGIWRGEIQLGTFVRIGMQAKGVGAALFAQTLERARSKGLTEMMAHRRADNATGLAYYERLGFVDIGGDPEFTLEDGRVVGQVHRRCYVVTAVTE